MQTIANQIIDALGGTTAVSRLTEAPLSTVHSWRKNGIPRSRLAHIRLVAAAAQRGAEVETILAGSPASPRCAACNIAADHPDTASCHHINCPIKEEAFETDMQARGILTKEAA